MEVSDRRLEVTHDPSHFQAIPSNVNIGSITTYDGGLATYAGDSVRRVVRHTKGSDLNELNSLLATNQQDVDVVSNLQYTIGQSVGAKEGLERWWVYWTLFMVALSCIACIATVTAFYLSNSWPGASWCYLLGTLVALSSINLVSTVIFSRLQFSTTEPQPSAVNLATESIPAILMADAPRLISRALWSARSPLKPLDEQELPVSRVIVCHTATESLYTTAGCVKLTRCIQNFHMDSNNFGDISYNFLIGGDGNVYEGRGWNRVGSHTKGHNMRALGIAFIGTFIQNEPNSVMFEAFNKLIRLGVGMGKISEDYKIAAHCQLMPTASPGLALVKVMQEWPQFDSSLPINKGVFFLQN